MGKQISWFALQPCWKIHLSLRLNLQSEIILKSCSFGQLFCSSSPSVFVPRAPCCSGQTLPSSHPLWADGMVQPQEVGFILTADRMVEFCSSCCLRLSKGWSNPGETCGAGRLWAWAPVLTVWLSDCVAFVSVFRSQPSYPAFVLESNKIVEAEDFKNQVP